MKSTRLVLAAAGALYLIAPTFALASLMPVTPTTQAQPPAPCERACSISGAGNCRAGDVTGNPSGDPQCAAARIGVPTYTTLSTFGASGSCVDPNDNNRCASGSCTSWQGQPTLGVAHRTFPFGTRMEVCNTANGKCAPATVVERGPDARVANVTVDARVELGQFLGIGCNSSGKATYMVLSVPGVARTAEPTGPTEIGIEAILAQQRNGSGIGPAGMQYQAGMTPYGYGYMGTPPPIGSAAYGQLGTGFPMQTGYSQQVGFSQGGTNYGTGGYTGTTYDPNTGGTATQATPAGSALNIIVWPHTVTKGGTLSIIWTSVNMAKDSCAVSFAGQQFAKASEGAKPFQITSFDSGQLSFMLQCQDQNGQIKTVSDNSVVQ